MINPSANAQHKLFGDPLFISPPTTILPDMVSRSTYWYHGTVTKIIDKSVVGLATHMHLCINGIDCSVRFNKGLGMTRMMMIEQKCINEGFKPYVGVYYPDSQPPIIAHLTIEKMHLSPDQTDMF